MIEVELGLRRLRKLDKRMRADRIKKDPRYHGKTPRACADMQELEDLDLPGVMPGESPALRVVVEEVESFAERLVLYYDPDGYVIQGDFTEVMMTYVHYRSLPENCVTSPTFYRSGAIIWVSTVYLGLDNNTFTGPDVPPVIWETMVFTGNYEDRGQWRYSTRKAAMNGHRMVVGAIRAEQRRRRAKVVAPRRCRAAH